MSVSRLLPSFLPFYSVLPRPRLLPRKPLTTATMSHPSRPQLHYITSQKASLIDAQLMSPTYAFTLDQLMELAGLSVAHAVSQVAQPPARIALVCGPGNNGGDGLVAARHLHHFGYAVSVMYPVQTKRQPFIALVKQLNVLDIPVRAELPLPDADLVVDAVFGFGFRYAERASVREPLGSLLRAINQHPGKLLCVDVPSGWDVDGKGKVDGAVRKPDVLISLTVPKICARELDEGDGVTHFIGGRFVPQKLCQELDFEIPPYSGTDAIVRVT